MKVIHKYPIPLNDSFWLNLLEGAKPLSFQVQGGVPTLWALVDTHQRMVSYQFRLAGTGHAIEGQWDYIGTIQQGGFVWHLFWRP